MFCRAGLSENAAEVLKQIVIMSLHNVLLKFYGHTAPIVSGSYFAFLYKLFPPNPVFHKKGLSIMYNLVFIHTTG